MPDLQPGDLSVPPTQLDTNVAHYEAIYKKCREAAMRIEPPPSDIPPYERYDRITNVLFARFCDDQVEAAKTKQLTSAIENLLGILGVRR